MTKTSGKVIHVLCPGCRQRLFDIEADTVGAVHIKFTRCRNVVSLRIKNSHYNIIDNHGATAAG